MGKKEELLLSNHHRWLILRDFMFVITDKDGVEYALSFEGEKPEGLSAVKDGDTVSVIYTGKLEQAEAFTGTIVSVTKE